MIISFVNDSNDTARWKTAFEKALSEVFKNIQHGEVEVIFNVVSPTPTLGKIDILIFINIENLPKNFYITTDGKYLHSLVIGIKKYDFDDVIDANKNDFFNEEGSWCYTDEIDSENKSLDIFCCNICYEVIHFKSALFYYVNAPHCSKSFRNDYVFFNSPMNMSKLLTSACRRCLSKKYNGTWAMKFSQGYDMHQFIYKFTKVSQVMAHLHNLT